MLSDFEFNLQKYAELIVKVGLNLQPQQRLLIYAWLPAAPLVRRVTIAAYQAGARFVDVFYRDEQLLLTRFRHAPRDMFDIASPWFPQAALDYAQHGDATLAVAGSNPDLLKDQDPGLIQAYYAALDKSLAAYYEYQTRNAHNWLIVSHPTPDWSARVFPEAPCDQSEALLWQALFEVCRVDQPDPTMAWHIHLCQLTASCDHLNAKQYTALHYFAPGTDLTIGLPAGHIWDSGRVKSPAGIEFIPNMPTEEVYTLPHKDRAFGVVTASKPLNLGGILVEDLRLTFAEGRIVKVEAKTGEEILRKQIETDEGAAYLGEVALVPASSPIARSGLLFYNTLLDENAASHIALGEAFKCCLQDSAQMSDAEFAARGGNRSLIHIDLMIGSNQMDVDGILADGSVEPIMRSGEWAFTA